MQLYVVHDKDYNIRLVVDAKNTDKAIQFAREYIKDNFEETLWNNELIADICDNNFLIRSCTEDNIKNCKYVFPKGFKGDYICRKTEEDCDAEKCKKCNSFDSRYIEYPLTIQGIDTQPIEPFTLGHEIGCLCEVKVCSDKEDKSYLGIYLGELPINITSSYYNNTGVLKIDTMSNPAIFVPELKKIVYGCESWWREIKDIEDFKGITQDDINKTWYVQLLHSIGGDVFDPTV